MLLVTDSLEGCGSDSIVYVCCLDCGGLLLFFLRTSENLKQNVQK